MTKAAEIARVSAKGSFHYFWGLVISTIIASIGTVFIANLLGSDSYGLYTVVWIALNLIVLFRDWGVNSAIVKFTAEYKAEGKLLEIKSVLMSGLIFEILLGLILTVISFSLSSFIANSVFYRPQLVLLLEVGSLTIFAGGLINAASAAFTGFEEMALNSVMLICQSIIKVVLIVGLVYLGLETQGAVVGFTIGTLFAGVIGILLMGVIYRKLPKKKNRLEIRVYLKRLFRYGMPISIANIIAGLLAAYYAFLLPIYYSNNSVIGSYGIAQTIVILISFFATPITTMLFPAFSKLDMQHDKDTLKNVFQASVKYASFLVIPVTFAVMCLAQPAISLLFFDKYPTASLFTSLLSLTYLLTAFGGLSVSNLIISQGYTSYNLKLTILTAIFGFPMGFVLIMQYGVIGLIVASLFDGIPSLLLSLRWLKKHFDMSIDWRSSCKILLSSALPAFATYLLVSNIYFASWIRLIIGLAVFALIWSGATLAIGVLDKSDIVAFRIMAAGLGFVGKILNRILDISEKLIVRIRPNTQ